jgi:hypothetical protein
MYTSAGVAEDTVCRIKRVVIVSLMELLIVSEDSGFCVSHGPGTRIIDGEVNYLGSLRVWKIWRLISALILELGS